MPHVDHVIPKILDEMQFHIFKIRPENQIFIIFFYIFICASLCMIIVPWPTMPFSLYNFLHR